MEKTCSECGKRLEDMPVGAVYSMRIDGWGAPFVYFCDECTAKKDAEKAEASTQCD